MKQRGFTLVELAVVLVIGATLLGAGLKILTAQTDRVAVQTTKKHQEAIKQSLVGHIVRYGRLPCPDANNNGLDDDRSGTPAVCDSAAGSLPYITLGLELGTVLDGWDNYIKYMPSPAWHLTFDTVSTNYTYTTIADTFNVGITDGAIAVSTRMPDDSATTTPIATAAAVLISHGKNGLGATNFAGIVNDAPTGADELSNTAAALSAIKREYTELDNGFGAFDDVVLYITPDDFYSTLLANGYQTTNPQAMLAKANQYVIAQILSTRSNCTVPVCGSSSGSYYEFVDTVLFSTELAAWNAGYTKTALTDEIYSSGTGGLGYTVSVTARGTTISKQYTYDDAKATLAFVGGFN